MGKRFSRGKVFYDLFCCALVETLYIWIISAGAGAKNLWISTLFSAAGIFFSYGKTNFFYKGIVRGYGRLSDLWRLLGKPADVFKISAINLIEVTALLAAGKIFNLMGNNMALQLILTVILGLMVVFMHPVVYIFCDNQSYGVFEYFRLSVKYMKANFLKYLGTILLTAVVGAVLITALLYGIISVAGFYFLLALLPLLVITLIAVEIIIAVFMRKMLSRGI